jgi:serine/threonine protein kinase
VGFGLLTEAFPAVPGYEVLRELGRGGMGVVYQARQIKLNRLVALKLMRTSITDRTDLTRFNREAEAMARLQHPHIVQIYDVGQFHEQPFLALEFVAGGSLAHKLDGTPLPPARAAELVETLARAIHAAHQQNIIHRDLKPANILLTSDGQPKIADFGLAKCMDSLSSLTQSGSILGTPSYMAPEQAGGNNAQVGPSADVYALGAILYELLTGRPPFKAGTAKETVYQVIGQEPVPPWEVEQRTPVELGKLCLKCLQKNPIERFWDAAGLAEALCDWLSAAAADPKQEQPRPAIPHETLIASDAPSSTRAPADALTQSQLPGGSSLDGSIAHSAESPRQVSVKTSEQQAFIRIRLRRLVISITLALTVAIACGLLFWNAGRSLKADVAKLVAEGAFERALVQINQAGVLASWARNRAREQVRDGWFAWLGKLEHGEHYDAMEASARALVNTFPHDDKAVRFRGLLLLHHIRIMARVDERADSDKLFDDLRLAQNLAKGSVASTSVLAVRSMLHVRAARLSRHSKDQREHVAEAVTCAQQGLADKGNNLADLATLRLTLAVGLSAQVKQAANDLKKLAKLAKAIQAADRVYAVANFLSVNEQHTLKGLTASLQREKAEVERKLKQGSK